MENTQVQLAIGVLVLANIGTIVTVIISVLKLAAMFGAMKLQIEVNRKDVNNAHFKIRQLEKEHRISGEV